MAKVENIRNFNVKSDDEFFFDTNVWIFLFAPIANWQKKKQQVYANLLRDIQTARATININSMVLSEYINTCLRMNFKQWKDTSRFVPQYPNTTIDFKRDYRGTQHCKNALETIKLYVEDILSFTEKRPDDFNSIDVTSLVMNTASDFNDSYHVEFCKLNNLKIVSDDKDIVNTKTNIVVITDNIK